MYGVLASSNFEIFGFVMTPPRWMWWINECEMVGYAITTYATTI